MHDKFKANFKEYLSFLKIIEKERKSLPLQRLLRFHPACNRIQNFFYGFIIQQNFSH